MLLQTDIRRALVHFGRGPFFRYLRRVEPDDDVVEELVVGARRRCRPSAPARWSWSSAASACATTSRAASRSTRELTYDLLVSIFQPTSPLHDGAVIVQGDRIAAAACFLPLSANPRLTRDLGSRHRAALGVTEENDAVALVVSEETGHISLVARRPHRARPHARCPARPAAQPDQATQPRAERRLAAATMD